MRGPLHITLTVLLAIAIAFSNSYAVLADGDEDGHTLETEVNGIHVSLASQNEWKKGENTIVVTLKDSAGLPVNDANVEILVGSTSEGHAEVEDDHGAREAESAHGDEQGHSSLPDMEMGEHAAETPEMSAHTEEVRLLTLNELGEHGIYVGEAHLESSGGHEFNVMFHVNGEMLQASFVVEIPGVLAKTIVLWSFVAINVVLVASAGIMKKQSIPVKGQQ